MTDQLPRLLKTDNSPWYLLIRIMVGLVFVSEGIQKFLFADDVGAGRFARIGIAFPEVMGPFVGLVEIVAGLLVLLGLATRPAAAVLIWIMLVAMFTTKIPILLGSDFLGFQVRELSRYGFWSMAHASRNDWSMLMGSLFLLFTGVGRWSFDRKLWCQRFEGKAPPAGPPQ